MITDRPWDDSVDVAPDPQLVSIAHACFDFARAGDTARLRAYVEQGVPVNLTDATGNTLLMLSAYHGHAETVSACFDFARAGDTARLRAYVEQGVPVNLTDATGNTLLMLSAYHGHAETVSALVALGSARG